MPLTDSQLRALRPRDKPYKVADERGLYVQVTPLGSKLWRFRYRVGRVEKKLSIGTYPDLSLMVEHRRVEDLSGLSLPAWLRDAL